MAKGYWYDNAEGKRIRELRKGLGLNQADFAEQLGLDSPVTISRYETGEREIPNAILVKISKLVNISLNWLLIGEGEMESGKPSKTIKLREAPAPYEGLSDLVNKLEHIYNKGTSIERGQIRGIIEEVYDDIKKKEIVSKKDVMEVKKTA